MKSHFTLSKYRTAIFWALALPVIYSISRYNYNLFHSLADGASIVIAASAFTIIWNSRHRVDNDYFLYTGIAFLFFAFFDLMHLLGNKNMGVFPEYGNLGPTFYIASRYMLSISLLIAPFFIHRKLNTTLIFVVYSLVSLFILLSIFYWKICPDCIVEGVGLTPFKVISDYIICLILLVAIGLQLINRRSFDSRVLWIIVFSIILSIATGLTFTLYTDPFGITNAVGHLLQIASFSLVYLAFIETSLNKPQEILFRKLKQNEETLAQNLQQLEDANKELESFSYSVSHDLRAPLRAIEGYSQILMKKHGGALDQDAVRLLNAIRGNTEKMGVLINDILSFAKVQKTGMSVSEIDMDKLAREVWSEIGAANEKRELELKITNLLPGFGDQSLIRQVLFNLISNAVKFTKGRKPGIITMSSYRESDKIVYCVQDNGAGFDMAYYNKLFGVFQRLHSDEEYEGTGVGLTIVQRIVQRHDGRVWAEGKVNEGACFYFTLPRG